ncbi:hypothetical protein ElyMa_000557600 [Elysia marginata]|uniref:Uncharacterized protein n=1 Tax=Elysia marginata TaxID=1093978 RepID=A0AAV4G1B1_9GAST|nr:hypothetical protein ElyMa_000557600 [Elysia marginata]
MRVQPDLEHCRPLAHPPAAPETGRQPLARPWAGDTGFTARSFTPQTQHNKHLFTPLSSQIPHKNSPDDLNLGHYRPGPRPPY